MLGNCPPVAILAKKIGLLGCGAIGTRIAKAIDNKEIDATLEYVYDASQEASDNLIASLSTKPKLAPNAHMLSSYPIDIVIEAASQDAVRDNALSVIQNRRDLVVMSVGALLDESVHDVLSEACAEFGCSIYIPSGAIAGLDALRSVAEQIESVTLTTTKHPDSLRGAPGAKNLPESGSAIIFEGSANDAVTNFPKNINVAALVNLGTKPANVLVRIIADTSVKSNIHEIEAHGKFGKLLARVENVPDPANPKTSRLAALSAIDLLKRLCTERGTIRLGA